MPLYTNKSKLISFKQEFKKVMCQKSVFSEQKCFFCFYCGNLHFSTLRALFAQNSKFNSNVTKNEKWKHLDFAPKSSLNKFHVFITEQSIKWRLFSVFKIKKDNSDKSGQNNMSIFLCGDVTLICYYVV